MKSLYLTLIASFILLCGAKKVTWGHASSGNWANPTYWDSGRIPTELDDVYITLSGNYTIFVTIGSEIKVRSLTIGGNEGSQILDVYLPFIVQEPSIILSNGILQLGSSLYGMGSITVEGKLKLCGSLKSSVNISDVDIADSGKFEVWYKSNENLRDCFDFPKSTSEKTYVVEDEIFGEALATGEISIIVPSTRNVNEKISDTEHTFYVEVIAKRLSLLAGGATTLPGFGYWISDKNALVGEKVTVVTVSANISASLKQELKLIAMWLARDLQQEAVFVRVDKLSFLVSNPIQNSY
eukprot:Phypoly_transcript_09401.p1 GENE.Phypoly_transcript_09401~~Phypoly_transcript_09401.p1  ORF type:complete len:296 (+),score=37.57 Phypoly_transcript_09401:189-1076(+)